MDSFPDLREIRNKWIAVVRLERRDRQWTPTPESRVCSLHFSTSQFLSKRVLHARAVPAPRYELPIFMRNERPRSPPRQNVLTIDLSDDIPDEKDMKLSFLRQPILVDDNKATTELAPSTSQPDAEFETEIVAAERAVVTTASGSAIDLEPDTEITFAYINTALVPDIVCGPESGAAADPDGTEVTVAATTAPTCRTAAEPEPDTTKPELMAPASFLDD